MTQTKRPLPESVSRILAEAQAQRAGYGSASQAAAAIEPIAAIAAEGNPDPAVVEACAKLDHSDTDNGKRLDMHFGRDLVVMAQEKARQPTYAVWTGTHWDVANGGQKAKAIAQRLGDRIAAEVVHIHRTPREIDAIEKAAPLRDVDEVNLTTLQKKILDRGEKAIEAHAKRVKRRMDHAVTSKNVARINAMLECLAPHIMRKPDDFNADQWMIAVENCTLRFVRNMERRRNPRFVSLEKTPDAPEFVDVCASSDLRVIEGHRRRDLITRIVPVRYDKDARCPQWEAFIRSKLPDPAVQRLVQVSSGLGLLGITVQYLFFHYGNGANGKSVYMETLCRLMGEAAVTLPATSIIGEGGSSGAASPDLARLHGKTLLRVKELPEGEDLRENLVKELTGGEAITTRDLFNGYFDFEPKFIAMMSGNGYPRISGTDDGIWRRMAVIHWPVQIAKEDRREFQEVVGSFEPEYPGILNWLLDGIRIYLQEGLVIPKAVSEATQAYRDDMDRTASFVARCVIVDPDAQPVEGKRLYQAYCSHTVDQGGKPMNVTAFGRDMGKKFVKDRSSGIVLYKGIRLVNVPEPADPYGSPPPWAGADAGGY